MDSMYMDLDVELKLLAEQIPFLKERNYHDLPKIKEGEPTPEPLRDVWTALSLLVVRYNDNTTRSVMTPTCKLNLRKIPIVRVTSYANRGGRSSIYDFPLCEGMLVELIEKHYVAGTPEWGETNWDSLRLSLSGKRALVDYLKTLP